MSIADLDDLALAVMARHARALLEGVGAEREHWYKGAGVIHFRKALTEDERALLPADWLALPAIDNGGGEDSIWTPPGAAA